MAETTSLSPANAVFYYGIAVGVLGAIAQFMVATKVEKTTKVDSAQLFTAIAIAGIATIIGVSVLQPKG